MRGYKEAAIAEVNKVMGRLKDRISELEAGEVIRLSSVSFNLAVPKNHAKDYDQVIKMVEMSVDDTLKLRADEFACYVMDDWEWKPDFEATKSIYNS